MPRRSIFSSEEDQFIKDSVPTLSHYEIAKVLNEKYEYEKFTGKQVKGRANSKGWLRPHHIYNRRFFETIDSKEKAYWLGFIYADGYVIKTYRNAEVSIQLQASDYKHLHKFNDSLEGNSPITCFMSRESVIKTTGQIINPSEQCQIRLYSLDMANDLEKLKLIQNKTYADVSPDLCYSDEINIAIIRGFFDGDGCLDVRGECHFTAFSNVFLSKVNEFLNSKGIKTTLYSETSRKQRLYVHRKSRIKFLQMLYSDDSYSYLDRKFNLAIKNINDYNSKFNLTSSYTTVNLVNVV